MTNYVSSGTSDISIVKCRGRTLVPQINHKSIIRHRLPSYQFHDRSTIDLNRNPNSNYLSKFSPCKIHQNNAYTHHAYLLLLCLHGILRCSSGFPFSTVLRLVPLDSSHPSCNKKYVLWNMGICPIASKVGHVTLATPSLGSFIVPYVVLDMAYPSKKKRRV